LLVDRQRAPQEVEAVDAEAEHLGRTEPGARGGEDERGVTLRHVHGELADVPPDALAAEPRQLEY
jgi:hypothetical protein